MYACCRSWCSYMTQLVKMLPKEWAHPFILTCENFTISLLSLIQRKTSCSSLLTFTLSLTQIFSFSFPNNLFFLPKHFIQIYSLCHSNLFFSSQYSLDLISSKYSPFLIFYFSHLIILIFSSKYFLFLIFSYSHLSILLFPSKYSLLSL